MADGNGNGTSVPTVPPATTWMSDVQRALALLIIGIIVFSAAGLIIRMMLSADIAAIVDLAKVTLSNLTNMALIALGFFFGNTMAKMQSDAGQQKVVEKLTSTAPATGGPVAPLPAPVVVVAWWSLLKPEEQAAIVAAAPTDQKAAAFMAAAQAGNATPAGLADLVASGLLTQARADAIKGT